MKKIAIIGAGISGLFLANLLEKDKTYSYKIFEKKSFLDIRDGYGIQLSVNSIKLLNEIGFNNINIKDIYLPKKVNFFDAKKSSKICEINLSQYNNEINKYTLLKRSKLIEFFLKNIPKNKFVFDSDIIDIKENNGLSLSFQKHDNEKFEYLVAADGIYSKTKQILFKKDGFPSYFKSIALRGNIQNFEYSDISIYLGPNFHYVIYPTNQNKDFNFIAIIRKNLSKEEILSQNLFNDNIFANNLLNDISNQSYLNLSGKVKDIKCFPIFVSKKFKIPDSKKIFFIGDAFYSFPPSFAQGASQSIEAANELFNHIKNNSKDYYKNRIIKTKRINFRSSINHFAFHLSSPLNIVFRNTFLKYLSKNKRFLENYLGKIYKS